jgi:uncharacterized protein (TIGR02466 family)
MYSEIFPSFTYMVELEGLNNDELREVAIESSESDVGVNMWRDPRTKDLIDQVNQQIANVHRHIGLSPDYKQVVNECWGNYNNVPRTSQAHVHPTSYLSAVYYVKVAEGSGGLTFMNPNPLVSRVFPPKYVAQGSAVTDEIYTIPAHEGGLIIFPAWLYHYVNDNAGDGERISIAFNTEMIKK